MFGSAASLAVVGTIATAVIAGLAAAGLFDLTVLEGLLLGSILASTDGAAIFAVLRGSTLRRRLARTLEGEAGFNDPVAVVLVLGFMEWITHQHYGTSTWRCCSSARSGSVPRWAAVSRRLGRVPATARAALGRAVPGGVAVVRGDRLRRADVLHGSGFLAVYITGLAIGSSPSPAQRTIATFHDGLAWVAQLVLFLVLGLLVFPTSSGR